MSPSAGPPATTSGRVALVPGVLALLPEYAGIEDPVSGLRSACRHAVTWLAESGTVSVRTSSASGLRVASHLMDQVSVDDADSVSADSTRADLTRADLTRADSTRADSIRVESVLVIGNGSACRTEKAPGHFDPRAEAFDDELDRALRTPDLPVLAALDLSLADELWADASALRDLGGGLLTPVHRAEMLYDDDPYGVRYWVCRWELP
ncbi:MAG: hypothetical protein ACRCYQ_06460 [Nocardioides sp.]